VSTDGSLSEQRVRKAAVSDVASVLEQTGGRASGLCPEEVNESRSKYGSNSVSDHSRYAVLKRIYNSFVNIFIITLAFIVVLGYTLGIFVDSFMSIAWMILIWSPVMALLYLSVSHLVKKRMLRIHGYFAC